MDDSITRSVIEKVLDWPFLFFILIITAFFRFRVQISLWISRLREVELSEGKLNFKIGTQEVSLPDLDAAITDRLRELQEEIESIRSDITAYAVAVEEKQVGTENEIPAGLKALLKKQVYPMLNSKLWLGRYVQTLAKASSVSEELMLEFCKSRDDIEVFKDGDRWVAALKDRTQGMVE